MSRRVFRVYVRTLLTMAIIGGLVIAALNVTGDPYRAFGLVTWNRIDQGRRKDGDRPSKAEMVMRGDWQAMFVGDSRVEVGLDPAHPALDGLKTYNLGLSGATWIETVDAAKLALRENRLKLLVVMVDFERFRRNEPAGADYPTSPFNPRMSMLEYRMSTLLGTQATSHAVNVLSSAMKNKDRRQRRDGLLIREAGKVKIDHEAMFRGGLSMEMNLPERMPEQSVKMLEELAAMCRARGTRLVLVVPPYHALVLERLARAGAWEQYAQWMRTMSEIAAEGNAELWDWAGCEGAHAEGVPVPGAGGWMRWYWETVHFTKELGDVKLEATLNGRGDGNVVRLTPGNVELRLIELRQQLKIYETEQGEQVRRFFGQ